MALDEDELAAFNRLSTQLRKERAGLERLDAYYEGVHRLEQLGLAVPPELARFVTTVNWPRVTADSIEQRCDIEGFRLPGNVEADADLWHSWQVNGLDEESQQAHLDAMIFGRSYISISAREDDEPDAGVPLMTVESPLEMTHAVDPRTRRVSAALRKTKASTGSGAVVEYATLYLPDVTVWLERGLASARGWTEVDRDEHNLGVVPVVPLVNRSRLQRRHGTSEIADVITLTDAACRALTNAQVATEVLAIPQRFAAGVAADNFVDTKGNPLTAWETYFGAVWATANKDARFGQFQAADLSNFERIINHYANLVSGVSGLPTRFYGQYTTNPPSEGSIVADESRLIMNAYRKHRSFGGSWELSQRIGRRVVDGSWNPRLASMETLWRNPETPTEAQRTDAVVKKFQSGLIPREAAWEDLGYSAVRRANLARQAAAQADQDLLGSAAEVFRTLPPVPAPIN